MRRTFVIAVFAALVVAAPASAGYPTTYASQLGQGVRDGHFRYTAEKSGTDSRVAVLKDDVAIRSAVVPGAFGIPTLGVHDQGIGLFRDRSAFVLQSLGAKETTSFRIVRTADLSVGDTITLSGTFAFDAMSPDGSILYLVQHTSSDDLEHYVVRAFDLPTHALRPGRIADKAQKSWVMQGWPAARTETADGRWVYTLYANPGGFPFVHALDTVKGVAHCVGISYKGDQSRLLDFRLGVKKNALLVRQPDLSVYRAIDRTTWAVRRK
jgi:hypothetical protein